MDIALLKGLQTSIPGRYARALFEVALEQNESFLILEKLKEFDQACLQDFHIQKSLPFFTEHEFCEFLVNIAEKLAWPQYLIHFFQILHERQRLSLFSQIIDVFERCCNHNDNRLNACISMPTMPTMSQKKKIQAQVFSIFGKKINYEYESIPDLLGGVIIQAENLRIDASLKRQINTLHNSLNEISLKGAA
ncbi:MAG: ATP synthase F1 subunit delta [Pseudomonadota bacterium]